MGQPILAEHVDLVTLAVARAKEGDTAALHFLYVRFADDVCAYVDSIVPSLDESREITQKVFGALMTTIQTLRAARGSLRVVDPARVAQGCARPPGRS